jgi:hypothetical protein
MHNLWEDLSRSTQENDLSGQTKEEEMPISEIIISHGRNQYKVNLSFPKPHWMTLMWGWYPDSESTPSFRWQCVDSVPEEVELELQRLKKAIP